MFAIVQAVTVIVGSAAILLVAMPGHRQRMTGLWLGLLNQGPWLIYFILVGTPIMLVAWMAHTTAWMYGVWSCRTKG
jgi:hypothetical protein